MRDRTVTISGASKTYGVTGWRVGWAIAPAWLTGAIRKVHEQLTVAPASPMQTAGVLALNLPAAYFDDLRSSYARKRAQVLDMLTGAGFVCYPPRGSYFVMTDVSGFGFPDADAYARHLVTDAGVVALPGPQHRISLSTRSGCVAAKCIAGAEPSDAPMRLTFSFSQPTWAMRRSRSRRCAMPSAGS